MGMSFELIQNILEMHFGKRGSQVIICLVLMSFGIKNSEIRLKFGVSYDSLRRYRTELEAGNIESLFVKKGPREKSELEKYNTVIMNDFEKHPPKSLRDAQERIKNLTGLTRSLTRIRVYLLKKGLKVGQ